MSVHLGTPGKFSLCETDSRNVFYKWVGFGRCDSRDTTGASRRILVVVGLAAVLGLVR